MRACLSPAASLFCFHETNTFPSSMHIGACGGTLACSTCHLVIDKKWFDMLDEPEDEELDMLDLAMGLTDT